MARNSPQSPDTFIPHIFISLIMLIAQPVLVFGTFLTVFSVPGGVLYSGLGLVDFLLPFGLIELIYFILLVKTAKRFKVSGIYIFGFHLLLLFLLGLYFLLQSILRLQALWNF